MHNENDRTLISTLDLRDSCMTDKNVRDLFQRAASALQSIEVVNLSNNRVGAEGITSIATAVRMSPINRLSDLDLSLNHLGDSGLTALKQAVVNDSFVYVQTLNLQGSLMDIDGELFQAFADAITNHCPVLSKLNVSHNNMGAPLISQDISHQENSKLQIDSLDSDNVLPSKSMLDYFLRSSPPLQSLEVLNLGSNKIEAEGVASLTRALMRFRVPSTNNLSNLNMSNNPLGLSGLKALQDAMNSEVLVNLRKLNLEGSLANDADINVVALSRFVEVLTIKCPYLKKLNLSSNNFVGERECGMHAEEPLFGINRDGISLAPSASSNHGRLYFIYCHLCRLSLSKHKLTSAVHDSTANIDTTAYYEPVEDEVMLEQVDPNNTIKKLVLNNNDFSHEGIHLLSSFVHVCSRLKYLRTNHCKINSDSLTILLTQISKQQASKQRFKVCSNLKSWDLSNNTIDDIGISVLLDCLPSVFSSLVDVDIDDNLITSSMTDVAEKEIQKHKKNLKDEGHNTPITIFDSTSEAFQIQWEVAISLIYDNAVEMLRRCNNFLLQVVEAAEERKPHTSHQCITISSTKHSGVHSQKEVESIDSIVLSDDDKTSMCHAEAKKDSGVEHEPPNKDLQGQAGIPNSPQDFVSYCREPRLLNITNHEVSVMGIPMNEEPAELADKNLATPDTLQEELVSENTYEAFDCQQQIKSSQDLTVNDLASVQRTVWEGRAGWYNIGLELGLTPGTLDSIDLANQSNPERCFRATLKKWLSSPELHPSWTSLAKTLRSPPVGLGHLAEQLPQ